jgi:ribosomal protein L7Ae-like RNA K-turn-binding protein
MIDPKIRTMIGFAIKSGNIDIGEELCKKGLFKGRISLLFIASDMSPSNSSDMKEMCDKFKVRYIDEYTKDELSEVVGKENKVLVGVTSKKFSREIISIYEKLGQSTGGGGIIV